MQQKQAELYRLPDDQLMAEAVNLSKDYRNWMLNNFEMNDEQIAYFKSLPEDFILSMGWISASNVIGRCPITMADLPMQASKAANSKKNVDVSVGGSMNYDPAVGHSTYKLQASVTWHL